MKLRQFLGHLCLGLCAFSVLTKANASYPLWTFSPNPNYPPQISINSNLTSTVVYTVQNQSHKAKSLVMKPIPGVIQTFPCQLAPSGQRGSSCFLILALTGNALPKDGVRSGPVLCEANSNGSPNSNQCYRPSAADNLNITLTKPSARAVISVDPFIIILAENSTAVVTVTNSATSSVAANNVIANIPVGSHMIVQSTSCGGALGIGANCTITFFSGVQEGPTIIPVEGDNTNTANVYAAVTDQPFISITSPVQQSRIVPPLGPVALSLQITNNSDISTAEGINIVDKASCPDLYVDPLSTCINASVPPFGDCNLRLTSPTPYAPCTITIKGINTVNSPTTLVAFSHLDGLVFQRNGTHGKVIVNATSEFTSEWTFTSRADIPGAMSDVDGLSNTEAIINNSACTNQCAARICRTMNSTWYLPAKNELQAAIFALCPGSTYPCAFGDFIFSTYWSSTQWFAPTNAYSVDVPDGNFGPADKWSSKSVRCIRSF